ncbi:MAG TPA: hypothetical protein VNC40_02825, partial [Gaiellaceae bacterium]|nr:hypothetical protein [Gaiellaceae bacterium]
LSASAQAKGRLWLSVPHSVATGRTVTVAVRTGEPLNGLRLVVVAPKVSVMDVVSATTQGGAATWPRAIQMPRDGFAVLMTRTGTLTWKAKVTFAKPGMWRLVIPNWSLQGYAMPLPLVKTIHVLT